MTSAADDHVCARDQIEYLTTQAWLSKDERLEQQVAKLSLQTGFISEYRSMENLKNDHRKNVKESDGKKICIKSLGWKPHSYRVPCTVDGYLRELCRNNQTKPSTMLASTKHDKPHGSQVQIGFTMIVTAPCRTLRSELISSERYGSQYGTKKIIIDTDHGIDDAMAIFVALQSPEVEVIGLTTIYGNVYTSLATRNSLHLLEVAGRTDIPVSEGSHLTSTKGTKLRIADFVHDADGLGNQNFPPAKGKPIEESAASFLVRQAKLNPRKVTVVALGPLTYIALVVRLPGKDEDMLVHAFKKGYTAGSRICKEHWADCYSSGAFAVNGNVNPAAEANIFGDPDAADVVFTGGGKYTSVGINATIKLH
ncbi:hypothetical protein VNO80_13266 [Phaseolus coccineus]|uniref:Inosine/uridine-preferring nucleoside hydrolase domain-containing protein n=1 Tax=Phaseolus coccineus TaxID=3886 RepID=A0AAN9N0M8_PHACN